MRRQDLCQQTANAREPAIVTAPPARLVARSHDNQNATKKTSLEQTSPTRIRTAAYSSGQDSGNHDASSSWESASIWSTIASGGHGQEATSFPQ